MEIREIGRKSKNKLAPEKYEEIVKKMRAEGDKMIRGRFEFTDAQGGWIDFVWRFFKGEPITIIKLVHGEECELPKSIVKHLNNTYRKIRKYGAEGLKDGQKLPGIYDRHSRVKFIPLDAF